MTFDANIVVAPEIPLAPASWNPVRRQVRATLILDSLASAKKPDWDRLLGIASVDLYAPGLNFVFGEADSRRCVVVFSLVRLRQGADGDPFADARRPKRSTSSANRIELKHYWK